ncbi:MAG TPA: Mut7-C RNAse domain-containing protein, partial [Thermoplasmata archaeon]
RFELSYERCSLCNGQLAPWRPPEAAAWPTDVPRERVEKGLEVYRCRDCGHRFWEGTHTSAIRRSLEGWLA